MDSVMSTNDSDELNGGAGGDLLIGGNGSDELSGGAGDDELDGGNGSDLLDGGDGSDTLLAGNGDDLLDGGDGDDTLLAGNGDDLLAGGDGNDTLLAGNGDDQLDGDSGNDVLNGGNGDDTLNYTLSENVGDTDFYDGGGGFDTLQLSLTSDEQMQAQGDIDAFWLFLASGGTEFTFETFNLTALNFEALEIVTIGDANTPPVAVDDMFHFDEDTAPDLNLLANDNDADGDGLSVQIVGDGPANGGVVVNADGTVTYTPRSNYFGPDSFQYQLFDGTALSNVATVSLQVDPVNDDPVANTDAFEGLTASNVVRVAVIGGADSSYTLAAKQLRDSTVFDFVVNTIDYPSATGWADLNVANYDVVVLGDSGFFDYEGETGALFTALNSFVSTGGGVVTTGWFASALSNNALSAEAKLLADNITPITQSWTEFDFGWTAISPINITVSDPAHEIVSNVPLVNNVYAYDSQFHEFAPIAVDASADQLATGVSVTGLERTAIAYDEAVGQTAELPGGRTVYLGGTYLANAAGYGTGDGSGIRSINGVSDLIFEQAIAWAAGARGTATVNINTAVLLDNDTDIESPRADFTFESFTQPGAEGASIALLGDVLVYTLGAQSLLDLQAGLEVTDSFTYEMSDGNGGFDTASVSLSIDTLL